MNVHVILFGACYMVTVDEIIDEANAMDSWMQWSTGFVLTLLSVVVVRYLMKKIVLDFVKATSFDGMTSFTAPSRNGFTDSSFLQAFNSQCYGLWATKTN